MDLDVTEGSSLDDLFASVDELATPEPKTPPTAGKTILVVDDSEMMRVAITSIVSKTGHRVIEAANGDEALDACEHNTPDLILLDWIMPEKSGLETLKELRAMPKMANTPIVLLTQVKDKQSIREAGVYKVTDYLSKPARPDRVRAKIAKYLG